METVWNRVRIRLFLLGSSLCQTGRKAGIRGLASLPHRRGGRVSVEVSATQGDRNPRPGVRSFEIGVERG